MPLFFLSLETGQVLISQCLYQSDAARQLYKSYLYPNIIQEFNKLPAAGTGAPTSFVVHINGVQKLQLLQNLKPHKASGQDNIPSRLLKETAAEIALDLHLCLSHRLNKVKYPKIGSLLTSHPCSRKGDKMTLQTTGSFL